MTFDFVDTRAVILVFFKSENFFFYAIKPNIEISLEDVVEVFKITKDLAGNSGVYSITDIRKLGFEHLPKEVTEYTAKNPFINQQLKNAIIIEGIGQKIFGNFYLKVLRPARQTKLFNNHEAALKWLGVNSTEVLNTLSKYN